MNLQEVPMSLADKIKAARKAKGWTQQQAAEQIQIQQSYLSKLENGLFVPSEDVIEKLANTYHIDLASNASTIEKQSLIEKFNMWLTLLAVFLIASGYLQLFFSDTYYTYQLTSTSSNQFVHFHVTDRYHGEKYIPENARPNRYYQLIGEREISRPENNLLKLCGLLLLIMVAYCHIQQWRKATKILINSEIREQ